MALEYTLDVHLSHYKCNSKRQSDSVLLSLLFVCLFIYLFHLFLAFVYLVCLFIYLFSSAALLFSCISPLDC